MDRRRWQQSLKKARAILAETPEVRARKQTAAERAAIESRRRQVKAEVAQRLKHERERELAMTAIEKAIDQLEDEAFWLLYGKSRGAKW